MPNRIALLTVPVLASAAVAQKPSPELAQVAAAYAAKITASAIFVSGRTLDSVLSQELAPTRPLEALIRPLLQFDVDRDAGTVTCRLGPTKATAVHRGPLGCALLQGGAVDELRAEGRALAARLAARDRGQPRDPALVWPAGEAVAEQPAAGIDHDALGAALDRATAEPDDDKQVHTRAVVVVHRGRIVGERYADGITADTALPGWSMTKTLTNTLVGMRVRDGELDLEDRPVVPGWQQPDPRARIGYRHLLSMTSGLEWNESYEDPDSDALRMLFSSTDHAAIYADKDAATAPDGQFRYASGATNLLCRLLRDGYDEDLDYWLLPHRLFRALGMQTAVLETDPDGTFVGSSYAYASARDWARLGLLYLQDGVFAGERVLPAGWVAQSTAPHPASDGRYGFQIWLNRDPDGDGPGLPYWPGLPTDMFYMAGHEGQYCVVSPTAELVIVRLGCTKSGGFDVRGLLRDVHAACPAK